MGRMMRSAVLVRRGRVGVRGAHLATPRHSAVRNLHNVTVSAELMGMPRRKGLKCAATSIVRMREAVACDKLPQCRLCLRSRRWHAWFQMTEEKVL